MIFSSEIHFQTPISRSNFKLEMKHWISFNTELRGSESGLFRQNPMGNVFWDTLYIRSNGNRDILEISVPHCLGQNIL